MKRPICEQLSIDRSPLDRLVLSKPVILFPLMCEQLNISNIWRVHTLRHNQHVATQRRIAQARMLTGAGAFVRPDGAVKREEENAAI